jgi:hypothetical protein
LLQRFSFFCVLVLGPLMVDFTGHSCQNWTDQIIWLGLTHCLLHMMVGKSRGSDCISIDWVRGQLLLWLLFVQGCWGFEFSDGGLFEESFERFVDSFDSFDFFVFFFELDGFLLVFELGLSECVLFF